MTDGIKEWIKYERESPRTKQIFRKKLLEYGFMSGTQGDKDESIKTLDMNEIHTKFNRLKTFFNKCANALYKDMEEGFEHHAMAFKIYELLQNGDVKRLRLLLISNAKATRNLKEIPNETLGGIVCEFKLVDLEYLYKIYSSQNASGDFEVMLKIPALKVDTFKDYESYLAVLDAKSLVRIYDEFGQRLLERNIRTFLQFRGNVNKGLKNTIEHAPHKFFAYNNGITAVASGVELDKQGNIVKIHNFQIVNGGQSASAIYAAYKTAKADISGVFVQMKLSVVKDNADQDDFIAKVAQYANTQNKVNKSDFFSNSPFHKDFKDYSRRIFAPTKDGAQRQTHWFYERVRGEYLNEQAYLTAAQRAKFQLENPKNQLIDKTFLAKSEMAWAQKPFIVAKGAQDSFAEFAKAATEWLEKDANFVTELYFKECVARVIIFKELEKLVSKAAWYEGGYRAQIVAYSVAYLSYLLAQNKQRLNFALIWQNQGVSGELAAALNLIAQGVYECIKNPPENNANVSQWCKKESCWTAVRGLNLGVVFGDEILINGDYDKGISQAQKRDAKREKRLDNEIEKMKFVYGLGAEKWRALLSYYAGDNFADFSIMQRDILEKFARGVLKAPSQKQCAILYELYARAIDEGFVLWEVKK